MAAALVEGGVKNAGKIDPSKSDKGKRPVRITGELAAEADLTVAAKAVNAADTPHKDQAAPGLGLVLFAKLDEDSAKAARKALVKLKGISAQGTGANAKRGVIRARLSGKEKLTVANVLSALKDAGIDASLTRPK